MLARQHHVPLVIQDAGYRLMCDVEHELLWLATTPHVSALCLCDVMHVTKFPQASPICVCILQAIITGIGKDC